MDDIKIQRYTEDEACYVFDLIESEGEDWIEYALTKKDEYKRALSQSITYVMMDQKLCIGYIRCKEDDGFGVYVYDLLVRQGYRGHHYGKKMIEYVKSLYPKQDFYIMSDIDPYYMKQGYTRVGSIFQVK
jgi:ribosomal protein S18 acetylase RimI-like enzyme